MQYSHFVHCRSLFLMLSALKVCSISENFLSDDGSLTVVAPKSAELPDA